LSVCEKLDACISICKMLLEKYPSHPDLSAVYTNYGSAVDDSGDPQGAIKIFDEGIRKYPGYYMLYFNKGLSLMRMKKYDQALESYSQAMTINPLHPSSNFYTASLLQKDQNIPCVLAYCTFLAVEPQSNRSKTAFDALQEILYQNVKKDGNNTTIFISSDMLDKKKKKKNQENDFSDIELSFSLLGALDGSKGMDSIVKTNADKFDFKLQMLIGILKENKKGKKGFYWEHYVPFFANMKEKNFTPVLSQLICLAGGDQDAKDWVQNNPDQIKAFFNWLKDYKW